MTGVTASQKTSTLKLGNTLQLSATVAPDNATNKSVTWSSSDATIATVDANGLVTPVKEGSVTVSVHAGNGAFSADVAVTVVPAS